MCPLDVCIIKQFHFTAGIQACARLYQDYASSTMLASAVRGSRCVFVISILSDQLDITAHVLISLSRRTENADFVQSSPNNTTLTAAITMSSTSVYLSSSRATRSTRVP